MWGQILTQKHQVFSRFSLWYPLCSPVEGLSGGSLLFDKVLAIEKVKWLANSKEARVLLNKDHSSKWVTRSQSGLFGNKEQKVLSARMSYVIILLAHLLTCVCSLCLFYSITLPIWWPNIRFIARDRDGMEREWRWKDADPFMLPGTTPRCIPGAFCLGQCFCEGLIVY